MFRPHERVFRFAKGLGLVHGQAGDQLCFEAPVLHDIGALMAAVFAIGFPGSGVARAHLALVTKNGSFVSAVKRFVKKFNP